MSTAYNKRRKALKKLRKEREKPTTDKDKKVVTK